MNLVTFGILCFFQTILAIPYLVIAARDWNEEWLHEASKGSVNTLITLTCAGGLIWLFSELCILSINNGIFDGCVTISVTLAINITFVMADIIAYGVVEKHVRRGN